MKKFLNKHILRVVGALHRKRLELASLGGKRDNQTLLQGYMEGMYKEADLARAFQNAKVKAAEDAATAAQNAVQAQLLVIKAAQKKLERLHDAAASAQLTAEATKQSRDAFERLLPVPGVSK